MSSTLKQNDGTIDKLRRRTLENTEVLPFTMTRDEVAKALQVTTKTVDNLWRQGKLPRPSRIGRGVRFLRSEVLQFIKEMKA